MYVTLIFSTVAALVGGLFSNMKYKSTFLRDNLLINDNILELSHRFKCRKVVSCLSTCVFPDKVSAAFLAWPIDFTEHAGR